MPKAYSVDLRWRVVWSYLIHHADVESIALKFCVSERSVRRYLQKFYQTGNVEPVSQKHRPPQLLGSFEQLTIFRMIMDFPGIYLHEMQEKFMDNLIMGSVLVLLHCAEL